MFLLYLTAAFGAWTLCLVDAYQAPAAQFVVLHPKGFEVSIPGEYMYSYTKEDEQKSTVARVYKFNSALNLFGIL